MLAILMITGAIGTSQQILTTDVEYSQLVRNKLESNLGVKLFS
jgi:hypothetical protein